MKQIFLAATVVGVSLLTSCGGGTSDEERQAQIDEISESLDNIIEEEEDDLFVSEDGNFSIDFIGANPTPQVSTVPTDVGDIEMVMFMYEKSVTEALMVVYSDYPSALINESNGADGLLEGAKGGALGNLGIVEADTEEKVKLDGHPGLRFTGNNGQYYVSYEIYLVNNRLYQIGILRDGSYAQKEEVDRFLGSFKLTNSEEDSEE